MNQAVDENFILGILGGMGPLAGIELQKRVVQFSPAHKDQEHIKMVCFTNPHINDRTACLETGTDFSASIAESLNQLQNFGATFGVIACNTAHAQIEQIHAQTDLPLVNIVAETVAAIKKDFPSAKTIGLLATNGTIHSGVYQKYLTQYDLTELLPDKKIQQIVMDLIYNETGLKSGFIDNRINEYALNSLVQYLQNQGADLVILGCTELSMLKIDNERTIDPLNIVAQKIVEMAYQQTPNKLYQKQLL